MTDRIIRKPAPHCLTQHFPGGALFWGNFFFFPLSLSHIPEYQGSHLRNYFFGKVFFFLSFEFGLHPFSPLPAFRQMCSNTIRLGAFPLSTTP